MTSMARLAMVRQQLTGLSFPNVQRPITLLPSPREEGYPAPFPIIGTQEECIGIAAGLWPVAIFFLAEALAGR